MSFNEQKKKESMGCRVSKDDFVEFNDEEMNKINQFCHSLEITGSQTETKSPEANVNVAQKSADVDFFNLSSIWETFLKLIRALLSGDTEQNNLITDNPLFKLPTSFPINLPDFINNPSFPNLPNILPDFPTIPTNPVGIKIPEFKLFTLNKEQVSENIEAAKIFIAEVKEEAQKDPQSFNKYLEDAKNPMYYIRRLFIRSIGDVPSVFGIIKPEVEGDFRVNLKLLADKLDQLIFDIYLCDFERLNIKILENLEKPFHIATYVLKEGEPYFGSNTVKCVLSCVYYGLEHLKLYKEMDYFWKENEWVEISQTRWEVLNNSLFLKKE